MRVLALLILIMCSVNRLINLLNYRYWQRLECADSDNNIPIYVDQMQIALAIN